MWPFDERRGQHRRERDQELEAMVAVVAEKLDRHLSECAQAQRETKDSLKAIKTQLDAQDQVMTAIKKAPVWFAGLVGFIEALITVSKYVFEHWH